MTAPDDSKVDLDLYSRQIGTYGLETMTKLVGLKVLISGLQGGGVETAKNLILAGPGAVTLHDSSVVDVADLGSNFYLTPSDVGCRTRAQACLEPLSKLNQYVSVSVAEGDLDEKLIAQHHCVVVCNLTRHKLCGVNEICRMKNVAFIAIGVYGLACSVFVDFGPSFNVVDRNGEPAKQCIIESVVPVDATKTIINCVEDKKVALEVGDRISISEVEGMHDINNIGAVEVTNVSKHALQIAVDTTKFAPYFRGGIVTQVKQPKMLHFRPYQQACHQPLAEGEYCLTTPDLAKFGRSEQLHIAIQALLAYECSQDSIPEPRDVKALKQIYQLALEINEQYKSTKHVEGVIHVDQVDQQVVENVANFAMCHISPIATFVGGIVAQEVIKLTGKYTPIHQWLYFDAFEILDGLNVEPRDCVPQRSRTDDQVIIWGHRVQEKLEKLRVFVVGAGALGCEYLKSLAMLNCSTAEEGLITVTDMDRIETSNLNRQFLFHREHVGAPKSVTAAASVMKMNPALKINAIETRVGPETEDSLTDDFWDGLDLVINALDNVSSRLYVDGKCIWHLKPLLECGTLGTKGNVQVVVPKLTESYGDGRDPPEESIPMCTLRHFPYQIEHAIEWARDLFEGYFTSDIQEAQKILEDPMTAFKTMRVGTGPQQRRQQLERIVSLLDAMQPAPTLENCVVLVTKAFHQHYWTDIAQLLHNFPPDHVTSSGAPFWSGPKRRPTPIELNMNDETHCQFLLAAANLYTAVMNLPKCDDLDRIKSIAKTVSLPAFEARRLVITETEGNDQNQLKGAIENQKANLETDDEEACRQLEERIIAIVNRKNDVKLNPQVFEKDDETNFHVDFVTAAGNLRARNYNIPEAERWRAKIISGKIIPAIATTTAMVTGLASLELIKLVTREKRPIEHYKSAFVNLALPQWVLSEPGPPKKSVDVDYDPIVGGPVRAKPKGGFTTWDKWEIDMRDKNMQSLVDAIQKHFDTEVMILSAGNLCLYNAYDRKQKERLSMKIGQLLKKIVKADSSDTWLLKRYVVMQACCVDSDGVDVNIPTIKCIFA